DQDHAVRRGDRSAHAVVGDGRGRWRVGRRRRVLRNGLGFLLAADREQRARSGQRKGESAHFFSPESRGLVLGTGGRVKARLPLAMGFLAAFVLVVVLLP